MIKEFSCGDINCCGVVPLVSVGILAICFIGVLAIVSNNRSEGLYSPMHIAGSPAPAKESTPNNTDGAASTYQYKDYIRSLLQIKCCEPGKPNLYADVDLKLIFANKASRTVKYFYIYAVPINRAWDVIQCNLRHYTQFAGKLQG